LKLLTLEKNLKKSVLDTFFALAFIVAMVTTLVAGRLIPFVYGEDYTRTSSILVIHIWAGIFMFMNALFGKWIFIEDALYFSLVSNGSGALVNVLLNYILIPLFGGNGAAIATLISYATSSYFFLFLYPKTRPLAAKMSKSFLLQINYISK
jgi:O-antigen/teichoic acid export membrane protein